MMRPIPVEGSTGVEWPHAVVDAPDAYYSYARVRVDGRDVTVFDQRGNEVGVYVMDGYTAPDGGSFSGMVNGMPFTVARDCDCGHGYGKKDKGA